MFHRNLIKSFSTGVLCLSIGISQAAQATTLNNPRAPIFLGGNIQPNIMFAVDDSGSMDWEVLLPQEAIAAHNGPQSGNLDISMNDFNEDREMCLGYNALAYNPDFTYLPWQGVDNTGAAFDNAIPTAARWNPYNANEGTVNVVTQFGRSILWGQWTDIDGDNLYDAGECPTAVQPGGGFNGRTFNDPRWVEVQSMGTAPDPRYFNPVTGLNHSEQVNFANWYSYYRKREHVLKAVMGILITDATSRMGLATLWNRNNVGRAIRDMNNAADKDTLLNQVYRINSSNGTPLRRLLNEVGKYYNTTESPNAAILNHNESSPIQPAADGGECQQNFTILMSDGFWNGGNPGVGNEDGDANTAFDGGPHADVWSNTLADVAMRYYETDLDTGLTGNVPTIPGIDDNQEQHMVTYTVAFGLSGTGLTAPVDHDPATPAPPWTQPQANQNTTIDDMIHAAFNGRGEYLNASTPGTLITALSDALGSIEDRTSSSASTVAFDTGVLQTDSRLYVAGFDPTQFTGSVEAFTINADGTIGDLDASGNPIVNGNGEPIPQWNAQDAITPTTRGDFYTMVVKGADPISGTGGTKTAIGFVNTDAELVAATEITTGTTPSTTLIPGQAVVDYIRGEKDVATLRTDYPSATFPGLDFRERTELLADIVGGSPTVLTDLDFGYDLLPGSEGSTYEAFLNAQRTQYQNGNEVVMVGSNGGMVHALSASSGGDEIFSYVPQTLHDKLHRLSEPGYTHEFYVNAPGIAADAFVGGWKKLYVSAMGEGGRGIFALDMTDSTPNTNPYLWEVNNSNHNVAIDARYNELGFIKHAPSLVRLQNGRWGVVVGNGYNSQSQRAQLFILDAADGSIIRVFDTLDNNSIGMSSPRTLDEDGDRIIDTIYVGDLNGNMWKIDVSSPNESAWGFAHGTAANPQPMFSAVDGNGKAQAIMAKPSLAFHPDGGFMVLFGTGKFIEPSDVVIPNNPVVDTFYGLRDNGSTIPSSRTTLVEQNVSTTPGTGGNARSVSSNPVDYTAKQGWYMDFDLADGERIFTESLVFTEIVVFVTFNPQDTPCGAGGTSFIMAVDFLNGAATQGAVFDFNGDGIIDTNDNFAGGVVGSGKKTKGGVVGGLGTVITKTGDNKVVGVNTEGKFEDENVDEVNPIQGRTSWRQIR